MHNNTASQRLRQTGKVKVQKLAFSLTMIKLLNSIRIQKQQVGLFIQIKKGDRILNLSQSMKMLFDFLMVFNKMDSLRNNILNNTKKF